MCDRISDWYECILPNGKRGIREEVSYLFCDDLWRYIKEFAIDYDILSLDELSREEFNLFMRHNERTPQLRRLGLEVYRWLGRQMRQDKLNPVCCNCNKKVSIAVCNINTRTEKVWCNKCIEGCGLYERLTEFHRVEFSELVENCLEDMPNLFVITDYDPIANNFGAPDYSDDSDDEDEDEDDSDDDLFDTIGVEHTEL